MNLGFHLFAFSIRLLLGGATLGALSTLGLLIFVEYGKSFVDFLTQLIIVVNSIEELAPMRFGSTIQQLTVTSTRGCPFPKASP